MEGLLCKWSLSLQEFDFNIEYRKGALNTNADALSRCHEKGTRQQNVAAALINSGDADLQKAQQQDQHIAKIYDHFVSSSNQPSDKAWKQQPLKRYKQIWPQLLLVKGCICRRYCPNPMLDVITVPIIPPSMRPQLLHLTRNEPSAGHQGH